MQYRHDVVVIGAGVSGLTTAVCLAEAGLAVRVLAAVLPRGTTSMAAGAMWGPYLVEPPDRVAVWSERTLTELRRLAYLPETGVRLATGIEASRNPASPPDWAGVDLQACDPAELPHGFRAGWRFTVPLVDMPRYLDYLADRLHEAGGRIDVATVSSLAATTEPAPTIVNCAGMGARKLADDHQLIPVRGQTVVVENPGISDFFSEDTGRSPDLLCIYPHTDTVTLGGTAQPGDWNPQPDPASSAAILNRCAEIEPRLHGARILDHRVGLRPTRPQVRLDEETLANGQRVLHNYGHGGAGVTLSWGCSQEITTRVLRGPHPYR